MKTPINQQDVESQPVVNMANAMVDSLTPDVPDAPEGVTNAAPAAPPPVSDAPPPTDSGEGPPVSAPPSEPPAEEAEWGVPFPEVKNDPEAEWGVPFEDTNTLPPPVYKYHADDVELMSAIRDYYKLPKAVSDEDAFDRMVTDRRWANNGIWNPFFRSATDDLHDAITSTDKRKRDLGIMISRFERMDTNGMESFLGNLGPALLQPENILSMGVGKVGAIGAKTAMKATVRGILSGAVVDGAANGLHNYKQQDAQVNLKLREHISAKEVAAMSALGVGASVLPGATFAGVAAFRSQRAWARKNGLLARKGDPAIVSDVSRETHEAGDRLFGRGLGDEDEVFFDQLQRGISINKADKKSPFSTAGLIRDKMIQGTLDKLLPIKRALETAGYAGEASTAHKAFNATYAFFRMLPRVGQTVEASLVHGVPKRAADGSKEFYKDASGHSHSLFGTLAPLGEDLNVFLQYVGAKRLITHPKLRNDFVNADDAIKADLRQIIDEGDARMGHFTDWDAVAEGRWDEVTSVVDSNHLWAQTHKNLKEYNRGLLEFARDSNLIGKSEVEDILESNEFYAPFYKDLSTQEFETALGSNAVSTKGNLKSISENWTDSLDNIRSLDRNLIDNTQRIITAAEQNHAYSNLYREFSEGSLKDVAELWGFKEVGKDHPGAISAKVRYDILPEEGVEGAVREGSKNVHFVFDGSLQSDMMMRALDSTGVVNALRDNPFLKAVTTIPKRVLVAGVTLEPTYVARNFIRDAITAGMFTENQGKEMFPFAAQVIGFHKYSSDRTARSVQEASMNGVGMGSMRQAITADTLTEQAKKFYRSKGANPDNVYRSPMHAMGSMFEKYYVRHINKVENASRLQEYDKTLARTENRMEAAMSAANVSTDFTMRGSNAAMTFANEIFPFFNAGLQGIYVTARKLDMTSDATRAKAINRLMVGFGILGGGSMALEMANSDIDVIRQADPILKDTHWLWPIDEHGIPTWDNERAVDYAMMPKPYDVGFFANLMEYIQRVSSIDKTTGVNYENNDLRDTVGNFGQYLRSVVFLDPSSPVLNALQGATNKNPTTWTGKSLIPRSLEGEPDAAQYTPSTPELYRKVGETFDASPLRVQFMAEALLGSAMREVAKGFDHLPGFRNDIDRTPNREWTMSQLPVARAFVRPGRPIPKAVGEFHALFHEIQQTKAAVESYRNSGRPMDMDVYMRHHPDFKKAMEALPEADRMLSALVAKNREYKRTLDAQTTPEGVAKVMDGIRGDINAEIVTTMAHLKKSEIIRKMIRRGEKD